MARDDAAAGEASTSTDEDGSGRPPLRLPAAASLCLPGSALGLSAYLGLGLPHPSAPVAAFLYGLAIVGAALLLAWAAEAIQVDINAGLALALLALLAVLPEYAVDFVFATKCGLAYEPGEVANVCSLALANMTGANRILVGVGWPLVVLVASLAVWAARRRGREQSGSASTGTGEVRLAPRASIDIVFLGIATLYSLSLPLRDSLTLIDAAVFLAIFGAYGWRLSRLPAEEPDLLGVAAYVGTRGTRSRRTTVAVMFLVAAVVIMLSAEHFAESLVETGSALGVSEFLLVQWVAPLASESPELTVACLYAWRLKASDSLGALLSSKVNQWTLLVGGLPIVFAVSAMTLDGLPLDTEQRFELLITGAQSLFAVAILLDRRLTFRGALMLISLFTVQFLVSLFGSDGANRWTIIVLSIVYVALALVRLVRHRDTVRELVKDGVVRRPSRLSGDPADVAE